MADSTKIDLYCSYQKDDIPDIPKKGKYLFDCRLTVDKSGMIECRQIVELLEKKVYEKEGEVLEGELCIWLPSCSMWMNLGSLEQAKSEKIKKFDFDQAGSEAGGVSLWVKTKKPENNEFDDTYDELVTKLGDKKKRRIKDVIRIIAIWLKTQEKEGKLKKAQKEKLIAKRKAMGVLDEHKDLKISRGKFSLYATARGPRRKPDRPEEERLSDLSSISGKKFFLIDQKDPNEEKNDDTEDEKMSLSNSEEERADEDSDGGNSSLGEPSEGAPGFDDELLGKRGFSDPEDGIEPEEDFAEGEVLLSEDDCIDGRNGVSKLKLNIKSTDLKEWRAQKKEYNKIEIRTEAGKSRFSYFFGQLPVKYHAVKNIQERDIICLKIFHKGILRNTYKITKAKIRGNLGNWCYEIDLKKYHPALKGQMKINLRLERNMVAEVLDVEDKTISDYLYFVKTGRKLSFQFNNNIDQKMIILRKHVKDTKGAKID
jgi:hypothetical protein